MEEERKKDNGWNTSRASDYMESIVARVWLPSISSKALAEDLDKGAVLIHAWGLCEL